MACWMEVRSAAAWIRFGNGARACIGRSWKEAIMAVATIVQKFDFRMADLSYTLDINQTLTIKLDNFSFYASPRKGASFSVSLGPSAPATATAGGGSSAAPQVDAAAQVMYVYYGSNTGSCEMFAQRVANEAASHGTVDLPMDGPVIILTASFEGEPPDNAGKFVNCVEGLSGENAPLAGVSYAVFGCGTHDWVHTFQRIPKLIDAALERNGAERLLERGLAGAGGDRFFEAFDEWETKLWETLAAVYETASARQVHSGLDVKLAPPTQRASRLRQPDAQLDVVRQNTLLTRPGAIAKHHLGMTYKAGDYLVILPLNPAETVKRATSRFGLLEEQEILIRATTPTTLPTHRPVNAQGLFSGYVELQQPATQRNIETLIQHSPSASERESLGRLLDTCVHDVLEKHVGVLSLLEADPGIDIPLSTFLGMLPAMRVRQYSISSSPLWNPNADTLTLGILRDASLADSKKLFHGVASNYLAGYSPATAFRSPSARARHRPDAGFLQERAMLKTAGRTVGPALLFFGCRSPDLDFLFADTDLKAWVAQGVVDVRPAVSRAPELSRGCKSVQDRVWHDAQDVLAAFDSGAKFFTCGSTRVALGIKDVSMHPFEKKKDRVLDGEKGTLNTSSPETPAAFWASIQVVFG
ncbi:riboflavin synthase domain-like protein [Auricularia subglabra TFB-10046 SS5]|nr:riboflavin synthase domain-like protein [Auricularia subglabra TFB-10046 SS5]